MVCFGGRLSSEERAHLFPLKPRPRGCARSLCSHPISQKTLLLRSRWPYFPEDRLRNVVFLLDGQNSVTMEEGKNGDWRLIGSFDHKSSKPLRLHDAGYKFSVRAGDFPADSDPRPWSSCLASFFVGELELLHQVDLGLLQAGSSPRDGHCEWSWAGVLSLCLC